MTDPPVPEPESRAWYRRRLSEVLEDAKGFPSWYEPYKSRYIEAIETLIWKSDLDAERRIAMPIPRPPTNPRYVTMRPGALTQQFHVSCATCDYNQPLFAADLESAKFTAHELGWVLRAVPSTRPGWICPYCIMDEKEGAHG